jgi:hypothetical protein
LVPSKKPEDLIEPQAAEELVDDELSNRTEMVFPRTEEFSFFLSSRGVRYSFI